jgi:hypothetical protein
MRIPLITVNLQNAARTMATMNATAAQVLDFDSGETLSGTERDFTCRHPDYP